MTKPKFTLFAAIFMALFSTVFAQPYIITGSGTSFTAEIDSETVGMADQPIQTVIDAIRTHANSTACEIQFGEGKEILDIGTEYISFNNIGGDWGEITLKGRITSANANSSYGAIYNASNIAIYSEADIENTAASGRVVYNSSTGTINITSGTISAATGIAIYNADIGKINISGTAVVTSANINATEGTVYIASSGTATTERLEINGGTVNNTSTGNAVYNVASTGGIKITGGTIEATTGFAVQNTNASGTLKLGGSPSINGRIRVSEGMLSVIASGSEIFAPMAETYTLDFASYSSNMIAVTDGEDFLVNFALHNQSIWVLETNDNNLVSVVGAPYIITGSGTSFTAAVNASTIGTANQPIQTIINTIRNHTNSVNCTIQFGNGSTALNIGTEYISFNNTGGDWGEIVLKGKIKSANANSSYGAIYNASNIAIYSEADIENTAAGGRVVYNSSTGTINITSGTISAATGIAIYNADIGKINISGTAVVTSANTSSSQGTIHIGFTGTAVTERLEISGGTVSNTGSGNAIYNVASTGGIKITGGTIETAEGFAVQNTNANGTLKLGGSPSINGRIRVSENRLSVIADGEDTFAPAAKIYTLDFASYTLGVVAVTDGRDFLDNFVLHNQSGVYGLEASGDNLVIKPNATNGYAYSKSGDIYTIAKGAGVYFYIQDLINTIRSNAAGTASEVQFGDGEDVLDIGTEYINFNTIGGAWGAITLKGKITSANANSSYGTIYKTSNIVIHSQANIANTGGVNGRAIYNSSTGTINISGGEVSATSGCAIYNASTGAINISGGEVSATSGYAIYNASTGAINISSGMVEATTGTAIYNNNIGKVSISGTAIVTSASTNTSQGTIYINSYGTATTERLEVSGGTVSNTSSGSAIYNIASTGGIKITGGAIKATTGYTIYNNSTGTISINGGEVSTIGGRAIHNASSGVINISGGEVLATTGYAIYNTSTEAINISGGEVSATTGYALYLYYGTANISGGIVSATTGYAVYNDDKDKIRISGTAVVTSANTNASQGTIHISSYGTATTERLEITDGTVSNTGSGNAIYNDASTGGIKIIGGTIEAAEGFAIQNTNASGTLLLGGNPSIDGRIRVSEGMLSVIASGSEIFAPTAKTYTLDFASYTLDMVAVADGKDFLTNFALHNQNEFTLMASGDNLVIKYGYAYAKSDNVYTITKGGIYDIQSIINAIRTDADGEDSEIQFGDGENILDIDTEYISFNNIGGDWGEITLKGKITSANNSSPFGTIYVANDITINSLADIANTGGANGVAIYNASTDMLNITGGTISATYGVYNNSTGTVNISNGTVSATTGYAVYNYSSGAINISNGTVSATTGYAVYNYGIGKISISETAIVTSANTNASQGTIYIYSAGTATTERLEISGGTVSNTSTGNAIYNTASTGGIKITGGTVEAATGFAVQNTNASGTLILGGSPGINGRIRVSAGMLNVIADDEDEFAPEEKIYALDFASYTLGMVAVADGKDFLDNFMLYNSGLDLWTNGNNLVVADNGYSYVKSGNAYTITRSPTATYSDIQTVLNVVRTEADNANCEIQFGNGKNVLNIGTGYAEFSGDWGEITLKGKITSANTSYGTIYIADNIAIHSQANIANNSSGNAIYNASTGGIKITGGTIEAATGYAIQNTSASGELVLGGSPSINGRIRVSAGMLSVIASGSEIFAPDAKTYTLDFASYTPGMLAVANGKDFLASFALHNQSSYALGASGDNLAIFNFYDYSKSENVYTITRSLSSSEYIGMHEVISAIRSDANGADSEIQFGNGIAALDIGAEYAEFSGDWGEITLKGKITSASASCGTICNAGNIAMHSVADIANTAAAGTAVYNGSTGAINISDGVVSATTGYAVYNAGAGKIGISETAIVTSANTSVSQGTIYINNAGAATEERLEISGGTVKNTATGNAIYNTASTGGIKITGGTVEAATGYAIQNTSASGALVLGGSPDINGRIRVLENMLSVIADGEDVFAPAAKIYVLNFASYMSGMLAVAGGKDFLANFALHNQNEFALMANGDNLITVNFYDYGKSGNVYTITRGFGSAYIGIQEAINAIRSDASGVDSEIHFESGIATLDIGAEYAEFSGDWGEITLKGKITSASASYGTIRNTGNITIYSQADIANTAASGAAIYNASAGALNVVGGTVSATGYGIYNDNANGSLVLGGAPAVDGAIYGFRNGKISIITDGEDAFAPDDKIYAISPYSLVNGYVAVADGKDFIDNFTLNSTVYALAVNGNDLVAANYTVSFNRNGGTGTLPANISGVLPGSVLSEEQKPSTEDFIRDGYANDGKWYADAAGTEEFVFGDGGTPVTADVVLYLKWIETYTVSFNRNGGTGTVPANISGLLPGSTLSEAQKPSTEDFIRDGYANDGKWYADAAGTEEFVFGDGGTPVTADIALYLKWMPVTKIAKPSMAENAYLVITASHIQTTVAGIMCVYDIRGNALITRAASPNESISIAHLPKGVYIAKIGGKTVKFVR